jgi:hypothetical protein
VANQPATAVLEPLEEDRARIERTVGRLSVTNDPTERADLASELSRSISRYEDAVEQVLAAYPQGGEAARASLGRSREALRDALSVIHERTMHIDARNAHAGDPEGFERAVDQAVETVTRHLVAEDACVRQVVETAGPEERGAVAKLVRKAMRTASERPHPPRTPVGRLASNLHVKLDHALEDVSSPRHPGAETIDGP